MLRARSTTMKFAANVTTSLANPNDDIGVLGINAIDQKAVTGRGCVGDRSNVFDQLPSRVVIPWKHEILLPIKCGLLRGLPDQRHNFINRQCRYHSQSSKPSSQW